MWILGRIMALIDKDVDTDARWLTPEMPSLNLLKKKA